jgi:stalled ribosome rescue protein Dom34
VSENNHAIVWLDHSEAKVFRISGDEESQIDIHSHASLQRLHHRSTGWEAGGNPPDDTEFFHRISAALDHSGSTVITGPGNAKLALKTYLDRHQLPIASRVVAVDTLDNPTTDGLRDQARRYFMSAIPTP